MRPVSTARSAPLRLSGSRPTAGSRAIDADPLYHVISTLDFAGNRITNLRQYLEQRAGSFGHVNGEDPCVITGTPDVR
jgi:hypothetical protein